MQVKPQLGMVCCHPAQVHPYLSSTNRTQSTRSKLCPSRTISYKTRAQQHRKYAVRAKSVYHDIMGDPAAHQQDSTPETLVGASVPLSATLATFAVDVRPPLCATQAQSQLDLDQAQTEGAQASALLRQAHKIEDQLSGQIRDHQATAAAAGQRESLLKVGRCLCRMSVSRPVGSQAVARGTLTQLRREWLDECPRSLRSLAVEEWLGLDDLLNPTVESHRRTPPPGSHHRIPPSDPTVESHRRIPSSPRWSPVPVMTADRLSFSSTLVPDVPHSCRGPSCVRAGCLWARGRAGRGDQGCCPGLQQAKAACLMLTG